MKTWKMQAAGLAVIAALTGLAFGGARWGDSCQGAGYDEECGIFGGGGEVPTPFEAFNQKAELADGEDYLLVGRVVIQPVAGSGSDRLQAFLQVDLDVHPWLASARRKANPYYPLEGSVGFWRQYRGIRIKLPCQAVEQITVVVGQKPESTHWLRRSKTNPIEPL